MADTSTYYKRMFYVSALWSWFAAGSFLFGDSLIRSITGVATSFDPLGKQLFCGCVIVFGIGYWMVGRDISRNRGIVWLGVIGKLMVVVLFFAHAIAGDIPYLLAAQTLTDLLFAALFVEFLVRYRSGGAQIA